MSEAPADPFPAYAWPGGYPIIYIVADDAVLCPACARGENGSLASTKLDSDPQWRIVASEVYWEGPDIRCAHCDKPMQSAYGDPETDA